MNTLQAIDKAFELTRSGERNEARLLLRKRLSDDPENEALWLTLSQISISRREKLTCLKQVLRINPDNEAALTAVMQAHAQDLREELLIPTAEPPRQTRAGSRRVLLWVGGLAILLIVAGIGAGAGWYIMGPGADGTGSVGGPATMPPVSTEIGMVAPTETLTPTFTVSPTASLTFTPTETVSPSDTPTTTLTPTPENTPTPSLTPTFAIPPAAQVEGLQGSSQLMSLSCEANVAAIWAQYYGVELDERTLQSQFLITDNPETGFVGNVHGTWGQIPPKPYGVHAQPVAGLLRDNGLNAMAVKNMRWEDLKHSIALGNPAIVWVLGKVWVGQPAVDYYAKDGSKVQVVPYEHTVIITGYDEEEDLVYILDGTQTYERTVSKFLKSWETLGNLAVVWGP